MSHSDGQGQPTNLNINPGTPGTATGPPPIIINNPPSTQAPQTQYFTAEQLEAARQQEKDKLYGRLEDQGKTIDTFKAQLEELKADKEARDKAVADAAKAAEDAQKREEQSKLSAEELIRAKEAELELKHQQFSEQMEQKLALMQKEQEFIRLQAYIQRRVAEEIAANSIIPDLVEFITGDNEAEVESSITKVKEKTANIVEGAKRLSAPQMPNGVSPTGGPATPFDALGAPRQLSREEIEAMSNAEYAVYRQQIGIDKAGNGKGLFN